MTTLDAIIDDIVAQSDTPLVRWRESIARESGQSLAAVDEAIARRTRQGIAPIDEHAVAERRLYEDRRAAKTHRAAYRAWQHEDE